MSWVERSDAADIFDLEVDQSYWNCTSRYPDPVYIYTLDSECIKCPFSRLHRINERWEFKISSANDYAFRIFNEDQGPYSNAADGYLCELNNTAGEFGAFNLLIRSDGQCSVDTIYESVNIYFRKCLYDLGVDFL